MAHPGGPTIKGLAVKLGDQAQAAVCYDLELLSMSCGWAGGFLKFSPSRYGLIAPPAIDGAVQIATPKMPGCTSTGSFEDTRPNKPYGPLPTDHAHYQGLSVHGRRVILHYTVGPVKVTESPWAESSPKATVFTREWNVAPSDREIKLVLADGRSFARLVGPAQQAVISQTSDGTWILVVPPRSTSVVLKAAVWSAAVDGQVDSELLLKKSPGAVDPENWSQPGPSRWGEPITTVGKLAAGTAENQSAPYVIDTLTIPFQNRYNALMFLSGHDFFANGDAAVSTAHGDVWLVSGIDGELKEIKWKRFATGLFQPLGLKIVKEQNTGRELIYVLGRDQITTLYDFNRDGEADYYHNFNNMGQATANSHEFATCLETDSQGNFYYLRGDSGSQTQHDGCLLQVSPDGKQLNVFATGFRNANGLGIGPDGTITVAPQEGTWTPGSAIFRVVRGGFYGAMQSHHRAVPPTTYDPPICWIPRAQDNSSGGQVWVASDRWGPLNGQLLHLSFGTCRMYLTLREGAGDLMQGGTVQFPLVFDSGVMRGRFRATDGQLYVTGLKGWVSSAVQDGCFQRVRYTGKSVNLPVAMKTYSNGMALTFASPLRKEDAEDPDNFSMEHWNYRWGGQYGSPDYRVSNPNQIGHDAVDVVSSTLLNDGQTVFLEIPDIKPAMQVAITYTISSAAGEPIRQTFNATLHNLGREPQPEKLVRKVRPGQLSPEIEATLRSGLILKNTYNGTFDHAANGTLNYTAVQTARTASISTEERDWDFKGLKMEWLGYLKVSQKSAVRFFTDGAQGMLEIDGRFVFDDPIVLGRGYHTFRLRYQQGVSTQAGIFPPVNQVLWKADGFPLEPIPPTALFHRSDDPELLRAQAIRDGRDVYRWRGCANCHQTAPGTEKTSSTRRAAPLLNEIGRRVRPEWLAEWIERPHQLRSQALMPDLFHPAGKQLDPTDTQSISDLVANLQRSDITTRDSSTESATGSDPDVVEAGRRLYQSLGCMGCHRLTDPSTTDDHNRVSLYYVATKFRAGRLAEFLRQPQQHYPLTRMPDFHLSDRESEGLESFLRVEVQGHLPQRSELAQGNAERGAKLFEKFGCQQCHAKDVPSGAQEANLLPEPSHASISSVSGLVGCLAAERPNRATHQPFFDFKEAERLALRRYLEKPVYDPAASSEALENIAETHALMRRLNCAGCHSIDGQNSPLGELIGDEGDGLPAESIPHLTWAGAKLRQNWIERLLRGELKYKPRPFLKARMPAFPAYSRIAAGLANEHGAAYDKQSRVPELTQADAPLIELGRQLTLKAKGLDCRQCHGVGAEQPAGDKATLIAPGINFSITAERMNFDFFPPFMTNPPRYDPSSRMPVFSPDGHTTAAKDILNGDAELQFEAIRKYLQSLSTQEKAQ